VAAPERATEGLNRLATTAKSKLTYNEAREFATIEKRLAQAELDLQASVSALENPAIKSDHLSLQNASDRIAEAQKTLESLYTRWAELEEKKG
jgi:ATP-binding cassette subfamily F protein uup